MDHPIDPQLAAWLDAKFEEFARIVLSAMECLEDRLNARFDRLETRMMALEQRKAGLEERTIALEERMARPERLEANQLQFSTRLDGLSEDMRLRFRTVNDRLAMLA